MTKTHPTAPMKVGDNVIVLDDGNELLGVVRSLSAWSFILVETANGQLFLDLVMNISAVSWSRIVLLEPWVKAANSELHAELAKQISYYPKRTNVDDVNGALKLCDRSSAIIRAPFPSG